MSVVMYRDYISYLSRIKRHELWGLLLNLGILIFSISLTFVEGPNLVHHFSEEWWIVLLIGLIVVKVLREITNFGHEVKHFFDFEPAEMKAVPIAWAEVKPSDKEVGRGFVIEPMVRHEYILFSKLLNSILIDTGPEWRATLSDAVPHKIRHHLEENDDFFIKFLSFQFNQSRRTRKYFTNELKCCLSEDLDIAAHTAVCHAGGYYDSFLTNEIAGRYLEDQSSGKRLADATYLLPIATDSRGVHRFADLTTSLLNNHIGASTLGITEDHYLLLWKQNGHDQQSTDYLIPTGSGSAAMIDWDKDGNLFATITRTMERELAEESSGKGMLDKDKIGETKILGFFRWLARGGKPEFSGLTKLRGRVIDFEANTQEVKGGFTSGLTSYYVPTMTRLIEVVDQLLASDQLSLPLAVNLRFLKDFLEAKPAAAEAFLFTATPVDARQ